MKLYRTRPYSTQIEEVEVTRFNDKSYWCLKPNGKESRSSRFTEFSSYFEKEFADFWGDEYWGILGFMKAMEQRGYDTRLVIWFDN